MTTLTEIDQIVGTWELARTYPDFSDDETLEIPDTVQQIFADRLKESDEILTAPLCKAINLIKKEPRAWTLLALVSNLALGIILIGFKALGLYIPTLITQNIIKLAITSISCSNFIDIIDEKGKSRLDGVNLVLSLAGGLLAYTTGFVAVYAVSTAVSAYFCFKD